MNVLAAESGSWAKPVAACCAATKALTVLTLKPLLKSASGSERGSLGGLGVSAAPSQESTRERKRGSGPAIANHCKRQHLGYPAMP